jgi:dTMP kinase
MNSLEGFSQFVFNEAVEVIDARKQVREILKQKRATNKKGLLICFEGIDGVGKSTQVERLVKYLKDSGYEVVETKWNSSSLLKKPIKAAKKKHMLSPMLYSLMHAADMIVRYENEIVPALNANKVVVSDRYIYTSMARDAARGVDTDILDKIYADIRQPDILFHCVLPIHRAFARLVKEKDLSYYGVGMDLNLADNMEDSYIKYENLVDKSYRKILPKVSSYVRVDMGKSIEEIAQEVQKHVKEKTGIGKYKKD